METIIWYAAGIVASYGTYIYYAAVLLYANSQSNLMRHRARVARASISDDGRTQMIKQPITNRLTVYGTARISGPITFMHVTEEKNLYILITLTGHPISSIDEVFFGDERVDIDASGDVFGRFYNAAVVKKGLGTTAGDAALHAYLQSELPDLWTINHKQEGCAKILVRLSPDRTIYVTGIPNISVVVRGKPVYDPRTATTGYSSNAALCQRDYLTTPLGLGATTSEINDTAIIAAANICDEQVSVKSQSNLFDWTIVDNSVALMEQDYEVSGSGSLVLYTIWYAYTSTFYSSSGETDGGAQIWCYALNSTTGATTGRIGLKDIPIGPDWTTGRKLYRATIENGVYTSGFNLIGTIADNTTTVFTDTGYAPGAAIPGTNSLYNFSDSIERDSTNPYLQTGDAVRLSENGFLYSEEFNNPAWSKTYCLIQPDVEEGPDGELTADKMVEDITAGVVHILRQTKNINGAYTYVTSVEAKADERSVFTLYCRDNVAALGRSAHFNLLAGTVSQGASGLSGSHGIEDLGDGWYRCWVVFMTVSQLTYIDYRPSNTDTPPVDGAIYTGDGVSGLFFRRAQYEKATTLGSYVPTTDVVSELPSPFLPDTAYYYIFDGGLNGKLATSRANALAGTAISRTTAGSGQHAITRTYESRYALHGLTDSGDTPKIALGGMLTACAGKLVNPGGIWTLLAGAYRTPTTTLDENDLDGSIRVTTRLSKRELCNGVKGVFVDPANSWQPTDLPPVTNATYKAQDNNEDLWRDVELPYTISPSMGQRLEKIELEKVRQQISTSWPCKLTALRVQIGDVVYLNNTRFGWSSKPFDVVDLKMVIRNDANNMRLGIDLVMRETASGVYDWNNGEETLVDLAPDTNLPNPFLVKAPTGLVASSGTDHLYIRGDGTVATRAYLTWNATTDGNVLTSGKVEVFYRRTNLVVNVWEKAASVPATETGTYIDDVKDGLVYIFAIRYVNNIGAKSRMASVIHRIVGKTEPPAVVTDLVEIGSIVDWAPNEEPDLLGYVVRYRTDGGTDFDTAIAAHGRAYITDSQFDTSALVGGVVKILVKSLDTTKHLSATAASIDIDLRPGTPTQFTITRQADGTREFTFALDPAPTDLDGFLIRYFVGSTSDWGAMTPLHAGVQKVSPFETNQLAAGTYTFACKAKDKAGNESASATFITSVTIADPRTAGAIEDIDETTLLWDGVKIDCHLDAVPNIVIADGTRTWTTAPATWAGMTEWNTTPISPIDYIREVDIGVSTTFGIYPTVLADGTQTLTESHGGAPIISFDGIDDSASVTYNALFNFERTDSFSLVAKMRTPAVGTTEVVFEKYGAAANNPGYRLVLDVTGQVRAALTDSAGGAATVDSVAEVDDNLWHTIGFTYDGTSLAAGIVIYIDGVAVSSTVIYDTLAASIQGTDAILFAKRGTGYADVDFSDAHLYKRKLTASEMKRLHYGITISSTNLIAHWGFNDGTGGTATDDSGNSLNATLTGATWSTDAQSYTDWAAISGTVTAQYVRVRANIAGSYPIIRAMRTLLMGNAETDYINDQDSSALTGSYRIGVGDIRIPLTKTFSTVRKVGVTLQNVGGGWSWVLIDKVPTYGPRVKIYNASGVLADCVFDADVDGLS